MGNKILGKRSRSFYKGFNEKQLNYLREKFESLAEKGSLKKEIFMDAYKMDERIFNAFLSEADFEEGGTVDEYEFICSVSYLCNLTV
jgi:Ca2+-binding EF-hand superfamily protein